jgi:tripartite-type tricarboxylate transporter receptor subunit TctC
MPISSRWGANAMRMISFIALIGIYQFGAGPSFAQSTFFADKTINVILGGPPAGSADLRTRAVVTVLRKYVPGNPTIVVQHMPAGGGRQAANHVYKVAKPDGLTIGSMGAALVANAVLGEPGVQYDIDKFIYLGTPDSAQHYIFITHRDAGLNSLEKLRAAPGVRIGSQSVGHPVYITGRIFAYLMGVTNAKYVTGYSGPELDLAITRREVDGRVTTGETMLVRSPEWLEKGLVDIHAGIEIPKGKKNQRFAQLAELESFAKSEREKRLLEVFRAFRLAGQNFFLPPGTPKDRAQILQEAMRKTLSDPEFYKEFERNTGDTASPLPAEALEKVIRELPRDPSVIELFHKLAGADPLPAR